MYKKRFQLYTFKGFNLEKEKIILFIACLFYILMAFKSSGYYHWDEHFQIIEFANYKIGSSEKGNLAWEYHSAIRPSLQPALCYVVLKCHYWIGVKDPFFLALILRLLTAFVALYIIRDFIYNSRGLIRAKFLTAYILVSYSLWFLPFINVRFSAETWSGLFLLLAVGKVLSKDYKKNTITAFTLGLILGVSILFKYQAALCVSGLFLWMFFIEKLNLRKIIGVASGVVLILLLGLLLDWWLYGKLVFSLYNYFHVNLIDGVASSFGRSPWYEYIPYILIEPNPILGLTILSSLVYLCFYKSKNVVVWVIVPYLIVHSIIPHKELRFLFVLANLVPFIIIYSVQDFSKSIWRIPSFYINAMLFLVITINSIGLLIVMSKGAGKAKISVINYINQHYKNHKVNLIYSYGANPYQEWKSPANTFYTHPNLMFTPVETIWQGKASDHAQNGYLNLLVITSNEMTGSETYKLLKKSNFVPEYQNIPWILQWFNNWYDPSNNEDLFTVFRYRNGQ